jgi:UDP-2-acetamido-3-amino-2,3-dideoxy-glucuronate N-acetyltransferase
MENRLNNNLKVAPSANIESDVEFGDDVTVWGNSHLRSKSRIGDECIIGENVYVGSNVSIGKRCKIQNNAQIYEGSKIEDGVFVGPSVLMTNDHNPRAINEDSTIKKSTDWDLVGVTIKSGASIGAGAILIAPIIIGNWSMVAAGAVVTKSVPNFALVAGVPAKQIGWVGKKGKKLIELSEGKYLCPDSTQHYALDSDELKEIMT